MKLNLVPQKKINKIDKPLAKFTNTKRKIIEIKSEMKEETLLMYLWK